MKVLPLSFLNQFKEFSLFIHRLAMRNKDKCFIFSYELKNLFTTAEKR